MDIKRRGIVSVAMGVLANIILGGIYAFSIFVPLMTTGGWGYSNMQAQFIYGLTIFTFTAWMILTGRLLLRIGPRALTIISGVLFIAGYSIASLWGEQNFIVLIISFPILIGAAMGFGYVVPLSCGILWFPKSRGVITGIVVAGYGLGGVILSLVASRLFSLDYSLSETFRVVGLGGGFIVIVAGLFTFRPPGLTVRKRNSFSAVIGPYKREFIMLAVYLFAATFPGVVLIGNLNPIGLDGGLSILGATAGTMALAVGNSAGRISHGIGLDRFPLKRVVLFSFFAVTLSIFLLPMGSSVELSFILASFFLGFSYGGTLVVGPYQTSHIFNSQDFSSIYPYAMAIHGAAAAIGAPLGGALRDHTGSFKPVFLMALIVIILGWVIFTILLKGSSLWKNMDLKEKS